MSKSKQDLREIFELDKENSITSDEREKLYNKIMYDVRRKRKYRFMWTISSVAAILISCFVFVYLSLDVSSNLNIQEIALRNKGQILDDSTVQLVSIDPYSQKKALVSLFESEKKDHDKLFFESEATDRYSTIYVPYGKRQELVLPDGSTVWLNAGSYLTFSNNMSVGDREVYLNGEGYFDIKHTGSRFIVRTKYTDINVLGTTFNTASYEDSPFFSIELLTGKVDLSSPTSQYESLKMLPGERVTIHSGSNKINRTIGNNGEDILWTKKQLALKNASMRDILQRIERVYNVKVKADSEVYTMNINYSGRLNIGVDIITSLSSIYELTDYVVEIKEKEVTISKKK